MDRRRFLGIGLGLAALPNLGCTAHLASGSARPVTDRARLRDLGIRIGVLPTGPYNAITDVPGVAVGHVTLIRGSGALQVGSGPVRTGVTAVLPHLGDLSAEPVLAADLTLNGNGEFTGLGPLRRTGRLGAPILLTDTGNVGTVYDGAMGYILSEYADLGKGGFWPEPVVGETWGDFLHDTAGRHVRSEHVTEVLHSAGSGPVSEGSVGGGTAMRAFRFKAGIGTASRQVVRDGHTCNVGVLVQANFGRRGGLLVQGVPVGSHFGDLLPQRGVVSDPAAEGNSLLAIAATDAPLLPIQLRRLCKRVSLGMARTGGTSTHGSGDLFLAFSTGNRAPFAGTRDLQIMASSHITSVFEAVVEATEEAILNSLTAAPTMVGRDGNTIHALPLDRLVALMQQYGRLP